ncbi:MAG: hypothetical protein R3E42_10805 [Burkholderiaceae bacterium]
MSALLAAWKDLPIRFVGGLGFSNWRRPAHATASPRPTARCSEADAVIAATGLATPPRLAQGAGLDWNQGIAVEATTLRTSDPHLRPGRLRDHRRPAAGSSSPSPARPRPLPRPSRKASPRLRDAARPGAAEDTSAAHEPALMTAPALHASANAPAYTLYADWRSAASFRVRVALAMKVRAEELAHRSRRGRNSTAGLPRAQPAASGIRPWAAAMRPSPSPRHPRIPGGGAPVAALLPKDRRPAPAYARWPA